MMPDFNLMKILVMLNVRNLNYINQFCLDFVEFSVEQAVDGVRTYRKLPTDESSYMAFLARTELNRDPDRKIIGLS